MYEHAMRLGQEVSGLDSLQKQVHCSRFRMISARVNCVLCRPLQGDSPFRLHPLF